MTEPTYEYIKGKGWVQVLGHYMTMGCGTVVCIVLRKPNIGEAYNTTLNQKYRNLLEFEPVYKLFSYQQLPKFKGEDWRTEEERIWVTFVPVSDNK